MKSLIDVQFPPRLCEILQSNGIDSIHVNSLLFLKLKNSCILSYGLGVAQTVGFPFDKK
jgi:predicted nuclease of predicted toxin-antitoxin system